MNYWITTHYPHPVPDTAPWHIYFRNKPKTIPAADDYVLFYETSVPQADRDRIGRKGIVRIGIVTGGLTPKSGLEPWVYEIPCRTSIEGFVSLNDARKIIRGPFFRQTLRRLTKEQYAAIATKMGVRS